jgi:pyrimidine deaminase RibD-like protein
VSKPHLGEFPSTTISKDDFHTFISYIHENQEIVDRLCNDLTKSGIKVWIDKNIPPGYRWKDVIRSKIREGSFFIACFSKEYNEKNRTFMNDELDIAVEELRQRPADQAWFIPVKLSECDIPDKKIGAVETLRDIQWVELCKDWDNGIQNILNVIKPDKSGPPFPKFVENDEYFMKMAIDEAKKSKKLEEKDPMVGAVLTKNGKVICKAYRGQYNPGEHAEYTLFKYNIHNPSDAKGATLYVTLEPCILRHLDKKACVEHVIESGVTRVVIGIFDPNPKICLRGFRRLEEAGIKTELISTAIRVEIESINYDFIKYYSPKNIESHLHRYIEGTTNEYDRVSEQNGIRNLIHRYQDRLYYAPKSLREQPIPAVRLAGAGPECFISEDVNLSWVQEEYQMPLELKQVRPQVLNLFYKEAYRFGTPFFDGPCVRLLNYRFSPTDKTALSEKKLVWLEFAPIKWFDYSIANQWFSKVLHSRIGMNDIDSIKPFVDLDAIVKGGSMIHSKLSNITTTATTLLSRDGYIFISQRGLRVSASPSAYTCAVAENIHQKKDLNSLSYPDPFRTVLRGFSEEISPELCKWLSPKNLLLLGISFDLQVLHPDLLFLVAVPVNHDQIIDVCKRRIGIDFNEGQLIPLFLDMDNPKLSEILSNTNWIPGGLASVVRTLEFINEVSLNTNRNVLQCVQDICDKGADIMLS